MPMPQPANTLAVGQGPHPCAAHSVVVYVLNMQPGIPDQGHVAHEPTHFPCRTGGAFEEEYEEAAPQKKELFYTEGPASLKQARLQFAHFSLDRAANRLAGAKRKRESPDEDEEAERADTVSLMKKVGARILVHLHKAMHTETADIICVRVSSSLATAVLGR